MLYPSRNVKYKNRTKLYPALTLLGLLGTGPWWIYIICSFRWMSLDPGGPPYQVDILRFSKLLFASSGEHN